jgi:hypothetical protein
VLADVLEVQHHLAFAPFRTFGDRLAGSPEAIVDGLFQELAVWSDKSRWAVSGFTRLVLSLQVYPDTPHVSLLGGIKPFEAYLAELLAQAGVRHPRARDREIWLLSE